MAVGAVLVGGVLLAVAAWHPFGRWAALLVLLGAGLIAATLYRMRPSAVPWRDDPAAERSASEVGANRP